MDLSRIKTLIGDKIASAKTGENKDLISQGVWVLLGQFGMVAIGLIALRAFTALMSAETFGEAGLMIAALIFGRSILVTPVSNAQLRFHPEYALAGKLQWFDREIGRLTMMASLLYAAIGGIVYVVWSERDKGYVEFWMLLACFSYLMSETSKNLRTNRLMAEKRQKLFAGWELVDAIFTLGVTVAMIYAWKTAASYVLAQSIAEWMGVFLFGYLWLPALALDTNEHPEPRDVLFGKIARYGAVFIPTAVLSWLATMGDRFVLDHFSGAAAVGYYAAATSIGSKPFLMVGGTFTTLLRPSLFEAQSKGDRHKANQIFYLWFFGTGGIGILGVLTIWLFGKPICWLLLSTPEFRSQTVILLPWVGMLYTAAIFNHAIENRILSLNRSHGLLMPQFVQAFLGVGLAFFLIPRYGIVGAAQARAIANLLQSLLSGATLIYYLRLERPLAA